MAGIDPVLGFIRRTGEDINDQLAADEIANLSPSLDTSSSSPMGQINSAVTKVATELWDLAEAEYIATDPDRNTGDAQDAVCAITGTTREPATRSQVRCNLGLNAGATVPVGALIAVLGNPTAQFRLVGAEAVLDVVVPGDVVAGAGGTYLARFEALQTGPVVANAGTLTVIVTPQTGWNSVTNPLDAQPGHLIESSAALRIRREVELAKGGSTTVDALRAVLSALLEDQGVTDSFVDVLENEGDTVDGDGRPPHSMEALIDDGLTPLSDDILAQTIWNDKPGGIKMFGSTTGNAVDSQGKTRVVAFNRPTLVPIYFGVTIVIDPDLFPGDGDTQVKNAMVALGRTLKPDADVVRTAFFGPIFSVPGVRNVTVLTLGTAPSPVGTADISIEVRQRATFDTSRISVAHV